MIATDELLKWISNDGFAIAIAVYLIHRIEKKLDLILEKLGSL